MEAIASDLRSRTPNIRFDGGDILIQKGFVQVPIAILKSAKLSAGGKLCYAMLLSYAWHNNLCFPGQVALGRDMGVSERHVRRYIRELENAKLITVSRQGLNRPNLYTLHLRVQKTT